MDENIKFNETNTQKMTIWYLGRRDSSRADNLSFMQPTWIQFPAPNMVPQARVPLSTKPVACSEHL